MLKENAILLLILVSSYSFNKEKRNSEELRFDIIYSYVINRIALQTNLGKHPSQLERR